VHADDTQDQADRDLVLQARLRVIGCCILVTGVLAAAFVAGRTSGGDDGSLADSKRYEYQMEILGGKSNLLATEFRDFIGSLWHGRRLAALLAVVSVGSSLACFFLAHRLNHSPALKGRRKASE
jgi:hypothetical protein